jgi:RHS repeat-associated protein
MVPPGAYDSNETSVSDSLGGLLTLAYDARDELTGEQFSGTGLSAEAVTYSYDNAGRLTGITRYSNLAETTEVAATAYSYDHANRMTGIVDTNSTGTTLVSYGYTYDAADRVSQEVRTWDSGTISDTLTYSYTNNNQLIGVTHTNNSFSNESFTWDSNGNETGTGYTTGTDNEQTASPGYTYTYDNAGEMTSETQTSTGDVWAYGYDFRGRMVTAVEKTSGGTTLESVTYTYDALDNRIGMDENGTETWTLYDSGNPIMDFNSSGSLTMRYLWGPTGVVARQTSGGTVSWYLADHLGTVRDLINNSGAIVDHVDFSAFGTVLDETSPTSGDRMTGFSMLERDTVAGLNLAVYREENPGTGRWNSQDPVGFAGGSADLYLYVANDPGNLTDSSGLKFARGGKVGDEAEKLILEKLGSVLGVDPEKLKFIKQTEVWKKLRESKELVQVDFYFTLDVSKTQGAGGVFNRKKETIRVENRPCEGYILWLDPRAFASVGNVGYRRTPNKILQNFVHELLHALLQVGGNIIYDGQPIFDKWHNPDDRPLGGGDMSLGGEQYAQSVADQATLPDQQPNGADTPDEH